MWPLSVPPALAIFIQGHTYLNHESNTCLIISESIQAIPSTFAVKIVRLKMYMTIASLVTLTFIQGHTCVSNETTFLTSNIYRIIFKPLHINLARRHTYTWQLCSCSLVQGHSGSAKANIQCWIISTTKKATSITLSTTAGHLFYVTLTFQLLYGLTILLICSRVSCFFFLFSAFLSFLNAFFFFMMRLTHRAKPCRKLISLSFTFLPLHVRLCRFCFPL